MHEGQRFGAYEVRGKLGKGGMGEVYLAHDARLQREVAIKVLPPELAGDPERLARLEREAQVLASLDHPNVAAVYGLEEADGVHYLVMQRAEGETLEDRLVAGPLPAEDTSSIALQIARGLEAAHERGVVHRDLKPANVMVAPDGGVKLLDFGLAKAHAGAASGSSPQLTASPTMLEATGAGVIMGTAAYMSPEQAKGRPVDRRADIWAFGVVLYEMLSGQRLFAEETVSETIAAVLRDDVDMAALPQSTPVHLRNLLDRCLDRDPSTRLRDIGEARIALSTPAVAEPMKTSAADRRAGVGVVVGLVGIGAAVAGLAVGWLANRGTADPVLRLDLAPNRLQTGLVGAPVISPDGEKVLYRADDRLWVRELGQEAGRELPGTEGGEVPFWSPDSSAVGYAAGGQLWVQALVGTAPRALASVSTLATGAGATWLEDGTILYAQGSADILQVSSRGGDVRQWLVPSASSESHFHIGAEVPDAGYVFVRHTLGGTADTILGVRDGERFEVLRLEGDYLSDLTYFRSGVLLFSRGTASGTAIWAVPFDADAMQATGDPVLVVADASLPSVSSDGERLLYDPVTGGALQTRERIGLLSDLAASREVDPIGFEPLTGYESLLGLGVSMSPDGRRVAFTLREASNADLIVLDRESGARQRLTNDDAFESGPVWSVDGKWIYYSSNELDISRIPADGSGPSEVLGRGLAPAVVPGSDRLIVKRRSPASDGGTDLWWLEARPGGAATPFLVGPSEYHQASVSSDGELVAFTSNETGAAEVFVQEIASGRRWQVSISGGQTPQWLGAADLYFVDTERVVQHVPVSRAGDGTRTFGAAERVMQLTPQFDPEQLRPVQTPEGVRFLTTSAEAVAEVSRLVVVLGANTLLREALGR